MRFICAPICQISDGKLTFPCQELLCTAEPQGLQIAEMPDILLDRPRVLEAGGKDGGRKRTNTFLQARRAAAQSFQHIGEKVSGEIEGELSFKPALQGAHSPKGGHMTARASRADRQKQKSTPKRESDLNRDIMWEALGYLGIRITVHAGMM